METREENEDSIPADVAEEPLLVATAKCAYHELLGLVEELDFDSKSSPSRVLPPELAFRVLQFLVIQRVDPNLVETIGCSSHDEVHPLEACLSDDETTWWISERHSMPCGRGREYIQLSLGPTLRRLSAVSIKIPPFPQGPLSVREFLIESPTIIDGEWTAVSQNFTVENRTGFQLFVLAEPVDVQQVRLVCLSNQISSITQFTTHPFESVGFFSVRFE
jgi:hypothetical protein